MQFEQRMHAVAGWSDLYLLLEKTIMLEVLLVTGVPIEGRAFPIMTPPITTCRMSFVSTLFCVRISLIGVPILTCRFFGSVISPFRVVTLEIKGSPSNTAFAMAFMVATFWTIVPISYERLSGEASYLRIAFCRTLASPCW